MTVDATVGGIALTSATYGTARYAKITIRDADISFTTDGTPPTATRGHQVGPGDVIKLESAEEIAAFRAIRVGSTDALIDATYQEMKLS